MSIPQDIHDRLEQLNENVSRIMDAIGVTPAEPVKKQSRKEQHRQLVDQFRQHTIKKVIKAQKHGNS